MFYIGLVLAITAMTGLIWILIESEKGHDAGQD